MTRTISLITATVGAALLLAGPASADNWGADRNSDSVGYLSPDGADRAAALEQQQLATMLDAREKSQTAAREASASSPDVFERTVAAAASLDSSPVFVDDRFDLHRQFVPTTVAATSSGWDVDPAQVGLGFGLGILLAIGLALAVRFTRVHRPAH